MVYILFVLRCLIHNITSCYLVIYFFSGRDFNVYYLIICYYFSFVLGFVGQINISDIWFTIRRLLDILVLVFIVTIVIINNRYPVNNFRL